MLAIQIAAEPGDPQHDLSQRWGLLRRFGSTVHTAVQRAPFDRLQQHFARQVAIEPGEQRRIQNAPTDYGKQRSGTDEPIEVAELPCFDTASALENAMPRS